jgi:hypothetical protein
MPENSVLSHGPPLPLQHVSIRPAKPVHQEKQINEAGTGSRRTTKCERTKRQYLFHAADPLDRSDQARAVGIDEF